MNDNRASEQYWLGVIRHFLVDVAIFLAAFTAAANLRLDAQWEHALGMYWFSLMVGAMTFAAALYVLGLYSLHLQNQSVFRRLLSLAFGFLISLIPMTQVFYVNFSSRIGRGVMLIGCVIAYGLALVHHFYLLNKYRSYRERVVLIVTSAEDESEAELMREFGKNYLHLVGVVRYAGYAPSGKFPVLGSVDELPEIAAREKLERVLCTNLSMIDQAMCRQFCQLRYSGVAVTPIISLFEEMAHCVPTELITSEWLLSASASPQMLYIKKMKRAFDIVVSLVGLCFFWPVLLLGMVWIKIASPRGSVFYQQTRTGRFGRLFKVLKLRTMRVDAESGAAKWASANDPRAIPGGNLLRKYRVDEIPQLWNVLRGEMSFVGPRPERPEFIEQLAQQIPFYQERFLVQPGITGWAQVNYPYGASVQDARHKLEYDLYYAKNMSVFLDVFILLDTVRIILTGGLHRPHRLRLPVRTGHTEQFTAASVKAQPAAANR